MKMENNRICEACRMAVTAGTAEQDPVLAEHLAGCPECRSFAEFGKRVLACAPAVPEKLPELTAIRARSAGGKRRMVVMMFRMTGMAAALALTAAVVFYPRLAGPESAVPGSVRPAVGNGLESGAESVWEDALTETPMLTWDARSAVETDFANAMASLRQGGAWNIELFNPIAEEM